MGRRIFLAFRSTIYVCAFMALWLWLLPRWLNIRTSSAFPRNVPARLWGVIPFLAGALIAIRCFIDFFSAGSGTPAPFDAPRSLVISGLYRYVRNPMYLGAGLFLAGCAILFADFSSTLLWYGIAIVVAVNLFIVFYEEPTLRRKFNGDYEDYCGSVKRWIPRTQPWVPEKRESAAGASG